MVNDFRVRKRQAIKLSKKQEDVHPEPKFSPPDEIASKEESIMLPDDNTKTSSTKNKRFGFVTDVIDKVKTRWGRYDKKTKIIIVCLLTLLVSGASYGIYALLKPEHKPQPQVVKQEVKKEPPKPTTEPSKLTGVQVAPEINQLPVTGIMIENSPDARPQSGIKDAGVIFEAIAEGGITRFLTLFLENQPDYIGPVRSVRPYYLHWLQGFDAAIAHVGGSSEALQMIRSQGIKDLDQFNNGGSYQRVTQRYAPHNVYTSMNSLLALQRSKGFNSSTFTSFTRKADKPAATPTAKTIDFAISGPLYNAHFDYDIASNTYKRTVGGRPHTDERSGVQISPKVVIGLVTSQGIHPDGIHTTYSTLGSGTAFIFQDGVVTQGIWSKPSAKEQFKFTDSTGAEIPLNTGQTWLSVINSSAAATFSP